MYLLTRIKNMNMKNFRKTINKVSARSGKNKILVALDIIKCGLIYEAGYTDYDLIHMEELSKKERSKIITRGKNNKIIKKCNNKNFIHILHNKQEFEKRFSSYLNCDFLYLDDNKEEFVNFITKHPIFIAKPVDLECGKKVELINANNKDMSKLYTYFTKEKINLLEERAPQNTVLNDLHPYSINTVRIVTLNTHVIATYLRIGNNKNIVDNFNHEGFLVLVDIDTGQINYNAIDKLGRTYTTHPLTGAKINGLTIPMWEEAKKLCQTLSKELKEIGYIGFDVCIGEEKCFIIEANEYPGHGLYILNYTLKKEGLWPLFKSILLKEEK